MKLLITGHCGFIGQNFVRMYKDKHTIVGIDKLGYASDRRAAALCQTRVLDIAEDNLDFLGLANPPFDGVINFAAESHVDNSIASPDPFMKSNFIGTFKLLEFVKNYKIPRFLQASTDEVYGDLQPDDPPFSDDFLLKPSSPYSASKAAADMLVLSYCRTYGINAVITRSCNNYGPFQYKEKLLPVVILRALSDQKIPVYGVGKNIREWIFVEDNCEAIMTTFLKGNSGEIYNIGSGMEITNIDLVKIILEIMDKPESLIEFVTDRKGHDLRYALDFNKISTELNWYPNTSLECGLRKTIDWYTKNPNYWRD